MLPALKAPLLLIFSIQSRAARTTRLFVRVSRMDRESVSPHIIMRPFDLRSEKSWKLPATPLL